jgi:hypothetical protein
MAELEITLAVLGILAMKGAAILCLVYVGSRLAIRNERRSSN